MGVWAWPEQPFRTPPCLSFVGLFFLRRPELLPARATHKGYPVNKNNCMEYKSQSASLARATTQELTSACAPVSRPEILTQKPTRSANQFQSWGSPNRPAQHAETSTSDPQENLWLSGLIKDFQAWTQTNRGGDEATGLSLQTGLPLRAAAQSSPLCKQKHLTPKKTFDKMSWLKTPRLALAGAEWSSSVQHLYPKEGWETSRLAS
jgi:hypothetical protein